MGGTERNEPTQVRGDAELKRFAEFVLGSAIEVLLNSIATYLNGQVRYQAILAKKRAGSITDPDELDYLVKHHALLIAHYLTCRQLDDFLTGEPPTRRSDDAHAWQFFEDPLDWKATIAAIPPPPPAVRDRVNKALLHLTFSDPLIRTNDREFSVDYTVYVVKGLEVFLREVMGGPIDEVFRTRTFDHVVKFREAFVPMVEENTRKWRAAGGVPPP